MNLVLIDHQEAKNGPVVLTGRRADHIIKTLRSAVGDRIRVGMIDGLIGAGLIQSIDRNTVTLAIETSGRPPTKMPTALILAMPRPIMLKRVLAQASSLGVERIFLINANRVEKSFFKASLLTGDTIREYLLLGLEQAIDTILPEISIHQRFRPFVEDFLPSLGQTYPVKLVGHPGGTIDLTPALLPESTSGIIIAIGPEGGWVDFEIDLFTREGFHCFSLGPRILRVDTAVPAILSQLQLLRELAADNKQLKLSGQPLSNLPHNQ